ncbi:MAG: nucleoside-diphosphate kinase [Alphaproteobacteria bacterium]|nr:nucleoside-diphosphate kinase [Alphaproteobacteria bacterium]
MSRTVQRTLSILKPDVTARDITGAINAMIEGAGFKIVAQRRVKLTHDHAAKFYDVHKERPFFGDLCAIMSAGPVVVQVLERDNAIHLYRELMGATDPKNADAGTIRHAYGKSIDENSVHGSDSLDTAEKEIAFFFQDSDIIA